MYTWFCLDVFFKFVHTAILSQNLQLVAREWITLCVIPCNSDSTDYCTKADLFGIVQQNSKWKGQQNTLCKFSTVTKLQSHAWIYIVLLKNHNHTTDVNWSLYTIPHYVDMVSCSYSAHRWWPRRPLVLLAFLLNCGMQMADIRPVYSL
jgi:hypothetical protein